MLAKPHRQESSTFLDWVRARPCCVCLHPAPSDPHHPITRGARGADFFALPMCREHHRAAQVRAWERLLGVTEAGLWRMVAEQLCEYYEEDGRRL